MSAPVFILDGDRLRADDVLTLDGEEGRHAAVVRRIRVGEQVDLTNGAGHVARCAVLESTKSGLVCQVLSRTDVRLPMPRISVVQALPKGDRGELAVELMTEVGVDEVVPWSARRCVTRWKAERSGKALRKWRSTVREAAKQSRRAWHPEVAELAGSDAIAARLATADLALVLHEVNSAPISTVAMPTDGDVVLVIGPEGGIDDDELAMFSASGAVAVQMGPTVMRTSTAGAVAAGVLLAGTTRWGPE